jgi:O-antigen ligase
VTLTASPPWRGARGFRTGGALQVAGFTLFALAVTIATIAAAIFGNGNLLVAVVPVLIAAALWMLWVLPLRFPLILLVFANLAFDVSGEGPWESPLAPIGTLLAGNLNKTLHIKGAYVPAAFVVVLALAGIHLHRRLTRSRIDAVGYTAPPPILFRALAMSFLTVGALCVFGYLKGGSLPMARLQVQGFVQLLVVAYVSAVALRGARDYRVLGAAVIAAACVKCVIALWVAYVVAQEEIGVAVSHGDSLLFACAAVLLIVRLAEEPRRGTFFVCLTCLPFLIAGMVANGRRLVWLEISAALLGFALLSHRSRFKRFAAHALIAGLPFIVGYIGLGWNSQAEVFAPLQTLRSVQDTESDSSTKYRELENYNLVRTAMYNKITGSGFGHPFVEVIRMPDISFFQEYLYMPHNSLLGLWVYAGPLGFVGVMACLLVAVYLAARGYYCAMAPDERVAAFMAIATVIIFLVHAWGDLGFSERHPIYLVGPALAIAGQVACTTGAWPKRRTPSQVTSS